MYRMGEQSPYTRQCAVQLDRLHTSWLHVRQIRVCTLMMATQADGLQCRSICVEMAQKAFSTAVRWWCTDAQSLFPSYYPPGISGLPKAGVGGGVGGGVWRVQTPPPPQIPEPPQNPPKPNPPEKTFKKF